MSDSIGARLRQARELRRLTLQQVSETTKVRTHYLQALENDDHSAIPSAAQARGFLRIYAEFLELDFDDLLPPVPAVPVPTGAESLISAASAASAPAAPAPQPSRPSLWASLRGRFARRVTVDTEVASFTTEPTPAPAEPQPDQVSSLPASTNAKTTRRTKAASTDVKKNAGK